MKSIPKKTRQWLAVKAEPVEWLDGQCVNLVRCHDITYQKKYEDSIEKLAYLDHLTGLPNRYCFGIDLRSAIESAVADNKSGYFLFIDMEDFKIVNDCCGHEYGDGVLILFANYLKSLLNDGNLVFRFGGDGFVILIVHQRADKIEAYLNRLLERVVSPWQSLDKSFCCTLSIGVAEFPKGISDAKTVLKNADMAMYQAKKWVKTIIVFIGKSCRIN